MLVHSETEKIQRIEDLLSELNPFNFTSGFQKDLKTKALAIVHEAYSSEELALLYSGFRMLQEKHKKKNKSNSKFLKKMEQKVYNKGRFKGNEFTQNHFLRMIHPEIPTKNVLVA